MIRHLTFRNAFAAGAVFFGMNATLLELAAQTKSPALDQRPPLPAWKTADCFNFEIESFPRTMLPSDPIQSGPELYHLRAVINGASEVNGVFCWHISWVGAPHVPPALSGKLLRTSIDLKTGWIQQVRFTAPDTDLDIERFDDVQLPTGAFRYYPLEFLPFFENREIKVKGSPRTLSLKKETSGTTTTLEATVKNGDREELRIRQTWKQGERFWSVYERYVKGQKDLIAKQIPMAQYEQESAAFLKQMERERKLNPPIDPDTDPNYYRQDHRLFKERLKLVAINPKRADILQMIQKASGVKLTVADNLADDDTEYGDVQFTDVTAYMLMNWMASEPYLKDGRWKRIGNEGYELTGEPKQVKETATSEDSAATLPGLPRKSRRWLTVLTIVGIVGVSGAIAFWRYRAVLAKRLAVVKPG